MSLQARTRWLLPTTVTVAVTVGLLLLWAPQDRKAPSTTFEFRIPRGKRLTYALEWRSTDSASVAGASGDMEGALDLSGELILSGLAEGTAGQSRVAVQLAQLRRHAMQVMGSEVFPDAEAAEAALVGPHAVALYERTGALRSVSFQQEAPPIFKHLVQGLLTELQVALPTAPWHPAAGADWEDVAPVLLGEARLRYRVGGEPADNQVELSRSRTGYDSLRSGPQGVDPSRQLRLASAGRITLSLEGYLSALEETNETTLESATRGAAPLLRSSSQLRLRLLRIEDFDPSELERRQVPTHTLKPGELAVTAETDQQLLEERAEGLTLRTVLSDLLAYGPAGRMPDHNRWLWRVTGLLKLHPELCAQLLPAFRDPAVGPKGRALILDLLVSAGHPLAQDALRQALLHSQGAAPASEQVMLLQRLSLLSEPDPQTLEFLARTHSDAVASRAQDLELASLYSLGAALGNGDPQADPERRRALNSVLLSALEAADAAPEREAALRALGNAGLRENIPVVLVQTEAAEAGTRRAAAAALRRPQTRETTDALLRLLADPQPTVQFEALTSLALHRLTPADLDSLAAVVLAGATSREVDADLVNFLAQHLHTSPATSRCLEFLAGRSPGGQQEARIRSLLAEAASAQATAP